MRTEQWIQTQLARFLSPAEDVVQDDDYGSVLAARQARSVWAAYERAAGFLVSQALMVVKPNTLQEHGMLSIDDTGIGLAVQQKCWVAVPPQPELELIDVPINAPELVDELERRSGARSFLSDREHFDHVLAAMESDWPHARTLRRQSEACWPVMHVQLADKLVDLLNTNFQEERIQVHHDPNAAELPAWFQAFVHQRVRLQWFAPTSANLSIGVHSRKVRLSPELVLNRTIHDQNELVSGSALVEALRLSV